MESTSITFVDFLNKEACQAQLRALAQEALEIEEKNKAHSLLKAERTPVVHAKGQELLEKNKEAMLKSARNGNFVYPICAFNHYHHFNASIDELKDDYLDEKILIEYFQDQGFGTYVRQVFESENDTYDNGQRCLFLLWNSKDKTE